MARTDIGRETENNKWYIQYTSSAKYCGYLQLTFYKSQAIKWAFILVNP